MIEPVKSIRATYYIVSGGDTVAELRATAALFRRALREIAHSEAGTSELRAIAMLALSQVPDAGAGQRTDGSN